MLNLRLIPRLTVSVIAISVLVAFGSNLGTQLHVLEPLLFNSIKIQNGDWWRVLTPIFVHFGIFHIGFNSVCAYAFGAIVEHMKGPLHMLVFTVTSAILSNLAEAYMPVLLFGPGSANEYFGGLSGVVYAYFGFIWMQSLYNPTVRIPLNPQAVIIILGWFAMCWIGVIPDIANWAHTGGLLTGIVWGWVVAILAKRRVQRR